MNPVEVNRPETGVDLPVELYATGLLIRAVEQKLLALFAEGKLFGTVHTCIGQEWSGIAVAHALRDGDNVLSNHRGHGHFLARTGDVDGLIAEVMGKQSGVCGGKGGSQHIYAKGFYSNGVQGGMMPVAAGMALGQKRRGDQSLTAIFIGDGTLGEGALYEALNIASRWELPLLVVLENNLYAQSTSQTQTLAGDICARAHAFGIRSEHTSTWAGPELLNVVGGAVDYIRQHGRPAFVRIDTYRLMAHSKGDDNRDPGEVQSYWAKDPLAVFLGQHPEAARLKAQVDERVEQAVKRAEAAPFTSDSRSDDDVPAYRPLRWTAARVETSERLVNLLHAGLERNMRRDERILLIGEDIEGSYGGAFKVTKELSQQFPGRVRNTPISESAIVGLGNGLGLAGLRPVCEIMFGDFMALAADQIINHAAKFRYMYNDQVEVPLIVRTPMGGKRGYGPTHSQSLEKHFLGIPGTRMLALHSRMDPGTVYDTLFQTIDRPTLVIENKVLYGHRLTDQVPDGFVVEHSDELFATTRLRPAAPADLTILCYGGLLPDAEKAAEQLFDDEEIVAEVLAPTQLYPLNPWPIIDSVRRSRRLLIVEEGQSFAAFGAEAVATLCELAPDVLRGLRRVAAPRHPIPSCGPLEKALLPGVQHIVSAAKELCRP